MKKMNVVLLVVCLLVGTSLFGQEVDLEKMAGYVNFEKLRLPADAECVTDVNIGPGLLNMLNSFGDDDDDEEKKDFTGLFSIRVKGYEINVEQAREFRRVMEKLEKKLIKDEWENIIRVKNKETFSIISMKNEKGKSVGALIMTVDLEDGEATFVNIVGSVRPETLSGMGLGLNDSTLNALKNDWN